ESNPRFLKDGQRFTFEMEGNLYLYEIPTGTMAQLTDIRSDEDPEKKPAKTEEEEYLKKQQADLFDIIKRQKEDKDRAEARSKKQNPKPEPYYLGSKKEKVVSFVPSPDGKFVGIVVEDTSKSDQGRLPIMPKYVTESGFVETQELTMGRFRRVKVGAPVSTYRTGVYQVTTGKVTWAEVELKDREVNHNDPVWADDSSKFAFVIGSVDHKDRWVAVFDIATGKTEIVDHERDEAWIRDLRAGIGGSAMAWLKDNDTLCYLSERDKWWHLYSFKVSTREVTQLTKGNWEIAFITLSKDKTRFYLTTTEVHPGERQLYSLPVTGGALTRITTTEGWHNPYFSPDETTIALSYSNGNTPDELFVMPNRPGAKMKPLTDSTTPEFKSQRLPKPQLITFPDADGNLIYGDLYLPETSEGKRPVVLYIHGAGYAQAVYKLWSNARLLHHYLAQQGYVVLSIDYRGSAGYGRDCRTAIYRHMGGKDVDSAIAAVEYLVNNHNVDRKRIGLYGGSYGGFYTLMALFTHPGVFAAGVAYVPVTDWAHYNHGYTSRILNLPYEDEEAYKRSSP
ncbi:MAG: prolyl oligopeptidase family serine peptidase, partial [Candidatus Aminicenantes bacterium]|nr:prolyl oligopeptidase family serine peptidase [Candidatus Aminicenantes bacterium]